MMDCNNNEFDYESNLNIQDREELYRTMTTVEEEEALDSYLSDKIEAEKAEEQYRIEEEIELNSIPDYLRDEDDFDDEGFFDVGE